MNLETAPPPQPPSSTTQIDSIKNLITTKNFNYHININEPNEDDIELLKWAEENIDEDPNRKVLLIEELRDMIYEKGECEPHRTDDAFLLRFLRARHFKVRMAHRLMVRYYDFQESHPQLFSSINFQRLLEIGETGIFNIPPYADGSSRRILNIRFGNWNPSKVSVDELFQVVILLLQMAVLEPKYQILGGTCIVDVSDIGPGHVTHLTPKVINQMLCVAYKSMPHRIHTLHIVNGTKMFDYTFSVIKPFLSDFIKNKVIIHKSYDSLHSHISPKYLPERYGGVHKDFPFQYLLSIFKDSSKETIIEEMKLYGYEDYVKYALEIN